MTYFSDLDRKLYLDRLTVMEHVARTLRSPMP